MFKKRSEVFDTNFVYFIILGFFVIIRIIASTFVINTTLSYILNGIIQLGLMLSIPLFLFSYMRRQRISTTIKQYGFKKINFKSVLLSLLIGVLVYLITIFIATFFSFVLSLFGYENSSSIGSSSNYPVWLLFVELIMTAVLPGICEEVAHRGMLLNGFKSLGTKKAILLSGLFFGLMHLNIEQFFYATIIGFFFGFIATITDSIFPVMIMHFTNNAISTFLGFAVANKMPIGSAISVFLEKIISAGPLMAIIILFLVIGLILFLMFYFTMLLFKETRLKRLTAVADQILKLQLRNEIMNGIDEAEKKSLNNTDEDVVYSQQMLGNKRVVNVNFKKDLFYTKPIYQPTFKDNIFMYVNLFLGIIVTLFTFIWGIL